MEKLMVSPAAAVWMTCRRVPGPLSLLLVTVSVAAGAGAVSENAARTNEKPMDLMCRPGADLATIMVIRRLFFGVAEIMMTFCTLSKAPGRGADLRPRRRCFGNERDSARVSGVGPVGDRVVQPRPSFGFAHGSLARRAHAAQVVPRERSVFART